MERKRVRGRMGALLSVIIASGCAAPPDKPAKPPSLAPATQPSVTVNLDKADISPMYRELLAVDLPTVIRIANTRNLDIELARQQVEANRGRYESNVEAVFPVIAPSLAYSHFQGANQNANGTLTAPVHFDNLLPGISIQWILNPGVVVYDIIASKRRMDASDEQLDSVSLETTRLAAIQYYDLILAQAKIQVAQQAVNEAQELLRITQIRVHAGAGLPADQSRAEAQLAAFQQDVVIAMNSFYRSSVALTLTLHLDPMVTLVPSRQEVKQVTFVKEGLPVDDLLALAAKYRPDLAEIQNLMLAAQADTGATIWGGLNPQLQAGYTFDSLKVREPRTHNGWKEQQKGGIGGSFALGLSTFGNMKTAQATERSAEVSLQRQLDVIRAAVVSAQQDSITNTKLIPVAHSELKSAEDALRLTQANLQAGTALVVDVLQAQNAVDDARLRYVSAVVHYDQSQINLLAALGLIDQQMQASPATQPTLAKK